MAKIANHLLDELSCVLTKHEEKEEAPVRCMDDELNGVATHALQRKPRYIVEDREVVILRSLNTHTYMKLNQIAQRSHIDYRRALLILKKLEANGIVVKKTQPGLLAEWKKA